jgi:hypothetical protein
MDERDMEEEGKNRKRKEWGIGKNVIFFGIVIFMFFFNGFRNPKACRPKKAYLLCIMKFLQNFPLIDSIILLYF